MFARRSIDIRLPPRIIREVSTFQIRSVPRHDAASRPHQHGQALGTRGITSGIEIEEVERACKTLDLNPCGLRLRFGEIVEHPRPDQRHDESDDGDDHQNFHQREAVLAAPPGSRAPAIQDAATCCHRAPRLSHPTLWLTDKSGVMTATMRPPPVILMPMMAGGRGIPTSRSSLP